VQFRKEQGRFSVSVCYKMGKHILNMTIIITKMVHKPPESKCLRLKFICHFNLTVFDTLTKIDKRKILFLFS